MDWRSCFSLSPRADWSFWRLGSSRRSCFLDSMASGLFLFRDSRKVLARSDPMSLSETIVFSGLAIWEFW